MRAALAAAKEAFIRLRRELSAADSSGAEGREAELGAVDVERVAGPETEDVARRRAGAVDRAGALVVTAVLTDGSGIGVTVTPVLSASVDAGADVSAKRERVAERIPSYSASMLSA